MPRATNRHIVLFVCLAVLAQGCFLRSTVGHVLVDSIGKEVEVTRAALSANATIAVCRDQPFEGRGVECTYVINGRQVASTVSLVQDFGLAGVFIDPLVLQIPDDVLGVTGTFNYRGVDEALDVTITTAFAADSLTTVTAEDGQQFAIIELPVHVREELAAGGEDATLDVDYSLSLELPRLEPVSVKPLYTVRVDVEDQTYYLPMLPCVADFAEIPSIEIPVADDFQNLIDDIETAAALVSPCDGTVYDVGGEQTGQDSIARLAGPDRIATAIEVSRATWPQTGQAAGVVIARADAFPDALTAAPLAHALAAPVLLTNSDSLDPRVVEEITRIIPPEFDVFVLGGEAAIHPNVVADIEAMGHQVFRIGGSNRFATAVATAEYLVGNPDHVYLADGGTFPAALLGGAAGAADNGRVLLTSGPDMPPETQAWIDANPGIERRTIGDPAATADPAPPSVTGTTAEMSVELAGQIFGPSPTEVFLASDAVFADGLSAGPLSGLRGPFSTYTGGPLLLTDPAELPETLRSYLDEIGDSVERAAIVGGTAAVSDAVQQAAATALARE